VIIIRQSAIKPERRGFIFILYLYLMMMMGTQKNIQQALRRAREGVVLKA
jgi:hypothetical protein